MGQGSIIEYEFKSLVHIWRPFNFVNHDRKSQATLYFGCGPNGLRHDHSGRQSTSQEHAKLQSLAIQSSGSNGNNQARNTAMIGASMEDLAHVLEI